jgi:hypothetical protein
MSLVTWFALYFVESAFCAWVLFYGGALALRGLLVSILFYVRASEWDQEGIKLYVGASWVVSSVWFVVGVFLPQWRLF